MTHNNDSHPIVSNKKLHKYSIAFTPSARTMPKRAVGHNVLYCTRKQNSFFLLDMIGLSGTWSVYTNHKQLRKASPYTFDSTSHIPNAKCLISKFLSAWFLNQQAIPNRVRHKYFNRIRSLLLDQWTALSRRLQLRNNNNRETKTYIKFSYKHTTFYLGFYIQCQHHSNPCDLPCAFVLSNNRCGCHLHEASLIVTPAPPLAVVPPLPKIPVSTDVISA